MLSYLHTKYDTMRALHQTHYEAALHLQATLHNHVLCELVEEYHLDDDCMLWAREWIDDYGK